MRKIEEKILESISVSGAYQLSCRDYVFTNEENTETFVKLWNNLIFAWDKLAGIITINNCGYNTNTTRSRLNCLLSRFGFGVCCRAGVMILITPNNEKIKMLDDHVYQIKLDTGDIVY